MHLSVHEVLKSLIMYTTFSIHVSLQLFWFLSYLLSVLCNVRKVRVIDFKQNCTLYFLRTVLLCMVINTFIPPHHMLKLVHLQHIVRQSRYDNTVSETCDFVSVCLTSAQTV
jgi:hypothetical protein